MKSVLFILILIASHNLQAQKYFTRTGNIVFSSHAPMEEIEAVNNKATSIFDVQTGAIEWAVLIKAFEFKKALMQTHFNENYMESSKMPKATFKGKIENISTLNLEKDGDYQVNVSGKLTIHGVTREVQTTATFTVKDKQVSAVSELRVLVADYKIEIPKLVRDNIAKEVQINIIAQYEVLS